MRRRFLIATSALVGLVVTALLVAASTWPVIHIVETGKTPQYPEVQPQYYSTDPVRVFEESRGSVEALSRYALRESDVSTKTLTVEATTPVIGFIDDMTVRVEPVTEFVTRVHIRSASRHGPGDLGQNARNIREFYRELDRRLGAVKFDPYKTQPSEQAQAAE